MPIKLSDITKATKAITVKLGDDMLAITFKTGFYTSATASMLQAAEDSNKAQAALIADTITEWDFLDDKGKTVPITFDTLNALPMYILNAIYKAMFEAVHPNIPKADS
jgi:hypothetical protein